MDGDGLDFFERLLQKKLILISGKGGTGKSLVAASLAQFVASTGRKVLVIESVACEQVSALLGSPPIGHREAALTANLHVFNIDPSFCFEEYVVSHLGFVKLYEKVFRNKAVKSFLSAMPGLSETMLLGRIFHACELSSRKYDMVIFDGPASGHFQSLLTTPQAVRDSGVGGPLAGEVARVQEYFNDHRKTGILLTTLPESLVISETCEFIPQIQAETRIELIGLILNKSYLNAEKPPINPNSTSCQSLSSYVETKIAGTHKAVDLLHTQLDGLTTTQLPLFHIADFGAVAEVLSDELVAKIWGKRGIMKQ